MHRLIAQTFLDNPDKLPTVNHIDGNKINNTVENLEWSSYQDNIQHAWDNNLNNADSVIVPVIQYSLQGEKLMEFKSIAEAKRKTGIIHINDVLVGRRDSAGGYYWAVKEGFDYQKRDIGRKKKVGQFTLDGTFITEYASGAEASRVTGINRRGIGDCCNGKLKTSGGFVWRFI